MAQNTPFAEKSVSLKVACVLTVITTILHIVGFSTHNWLKIGIGPASITMGLWRYCYCHDLGICLCSDAVLGDGNMDIGYLLNVKILECIGLAGLIFCLFCVVAFLFYTDHCVLKRINMSIMFASAGLILSGVINFGVNVKQFVHYSFGLCAAAAVFAGICGILFLHDLCTAMNTYQRNQQQRGGPYAPTGQVLQPPPGQVVYSSGQGPTVQYVHTGYSGPQAGGMAPGYYPQAQPPPDYKQ